MSTILKALKKLEEERQAATGQPLSRQVLADTGHRKHRVRRLPYLLAGGIGGLFFACLVVAGMAWLTDFRPWHMVPATEVAPSQQKDSVPISTSPAKDTYRSAADVSVQLPPSQEAPITPTTPTDTGQGHGNASIPGTMPPSTSSAPPNGHETASRHEQLQPSFHAVVSAIFPASGEGGRMAVVNGLPVMEGTRIDTALVKEIHDNEVIFEIDGSAVAVRVQANE